MKKGIIFSILAVILVGGIIGIKIHMDKLEKERYGNAIASIFNDTDELKSEKTGTGEVAQGENEIELAEDGEILQVQTIYSGKYLVDGEEVELSLKESDGKLRFFVIGSAKTEEKASIMLAVFMSKFRELEDSLDGCSIRVYCGEAYALYATTDNGYIISGKNRDGSIALSVPDWIVSEFSMAEEEIITYSNEVLLTLQQFKDDNPSIVE